MVSRLAESGNKADTDCGRKGNKIIRDSGKGDIAQLKNGHGDMVCERYTCTTQKEKRKETARTGIEHTNPERVLIQKSTEVKVLNVFPYRIVMTADGVVKERGRS